MGKKSKYVKENKNLKKMVELELSSTPIDKNNYFLQSLEDINEKKQIDNPRLNFFSCSFNQRLKAIQNFLTEYLKYKAINIEQANYESELAKMNQNIGQVIENQCIKIFQIELSYVKNDIQKKKQEMNQEIINMRKVKDQILQKMLKLESFQVDQISEHLQIFEKKQKQKRNIYDRYLGLQKKARDVYEKSILNIQIEQI